MKKSITTTLLFSAVLAMSAQLYSEVIPQDEYKDEYIDATSEEASKNGTSTGKTKKKKSEHPVRDFFLGEEKYVEYEEVALGTGTLTFGNKQRVGTMLFNPKLDQAGVRTYFQTCFFNFLFEDKARNLIIVAAQNYLDDFENKKLVRKSGKTKKCYGKGKAYEEWGTLKIMMNAFAHTDFYVGYTFVKDSPYFMITIKQAKNENERMGEYAMKESVEVQLYFTKAQIKEFTRLLSPATLKQYVLELEQEMSSDNRREDVYEDAPDQNDTLKDEKSE